MRPNHRCQQAVRARTQVAGRAVAGKQAGRHMYSYIYSQILVREVEAGTYDAISRDVCLEVFAGQRGKVSFHLSPRVHASTHEPGNTRCFFNEHTHCGQCGVTDSQYSQTLGALVAVAPFSPFLHTHQAKPRTDRDSGVPRFDIVPPWSLSLRSQTGSARARKVHVDYKAVCAQCL